MHLVESQNFYPDCISLTLDSSFASQGTDTSFTPILTFSFGEQWKYLLQGRIKFRLRGGKLHIKGENGQIKPLLPANYINYHLDFHNDSELMGTFRLDLAQKDLPLTYSSLKLAQFTPTSSPYRLIITWEISPYDIFLTDAEGLWKHDLSPNKHAILERSIIFKLYKTRFTPFLSSLHLTSDEATKYTLLGQNRSESIEPEVLSELQRIIDRIYPAKTDDFMELAQLARLNPLTDLEGGNFLATSLNGVELGEAKLNHTNFRGANLTDVDLGEAQLSYAKLSGADLSGAYLGNADLSYANFYRGSLALANLIGANLTEANLIETNLSQANLSGAIVTNAKFGQNVGLTPEMKESLTQRGAIFQES